MSEPKSSSAPPGSIRIYDHDKDFKYVRYLIGASILSRTGPANVHLFWSNPLVYIWLITFSVYVPLKYTVFANEASGRADFKFMGMKMMMCMPVFVGPPLVLLAILNWCHRVHFNLTMRKALYADDMRDPKSYYGPTTRLGNGVISPSMWILEYDGRQLGVVSVDDGSEQPHGSQSLDHHQARDNSAVSDTQTMRIRHLATSLSFRPAGIDLDLASHAVSICFAGHHTVGCVMIKLVPVLDEVQIGALEKIGFKRAISAQLPPSSLSKRLASTLRTAFGWPDCHKQWREETWVLERSQFNPKSD